MTHLTLIHTVGSLVSVFGALGDELLPGVERTDVVDEGLLAETIAAGAIPDATARRLERHVAAAIDRGANLVLVTCSSVGPAVERIRERTGWPLLRVDEAMADRALERGRRIGVIATLATTLEPTADLLRRRARRPGFAAAADVEVVSHLCEGAFEALKAGDLERHDALVRAGLRELLPRVDVVVLAQASMARVAATLDPDDSADKSILASPRLAMERVAATLRPGLTAGG